MKRKDSPQQFSKSAKVLSGAKVSRSDFQKAPKFSESA
jgi:hypothetical protein